MWHMETHTGLNKLPFEEIIGTYKVFWIEALFKNEVSKVNL